MPSACILAIRSLAGFEKLHSSIAQVATVSLHPHWHAMWEPTRRTSTLGFSAALLAQAQAASASANRLLWNLSILSRNPHHFGAGVLHLHFAGHQAHQRAADQHQTADPDPGD